MAHMAQMLTQEPIYKPSSIFYFKPILLSAHKLILLIYGDNIKDCHIKILSLEFECLNKIKGALERYEWRTTQFKACGEYCWHTV